MVSGFKGVPRNPLFGIMPGRKGHFSGGHFITCSVSYLHGLVGKRTMVPQKHKVCQDCSMKNLKTHFLWIEHGFRIQMSPKKPHVCYNGRETGSFEWRAFHWLLGMSLAFFGGEPDRGATKAQNISNLLDEKSENSLPLDRAWF